MAMLVVETLVVMIVAVGIGVGLGALLRTAAGPGARDPAFADGESVPETEPVGPAAAAGAAEADDAIIDPDRAAAADQVGVRPPALAGPRDHRPDDLRLIRGIGPQSEERLRALGVYHVDQIADWSGEEMRWIGAYLGMPGRVEREDWSGQARRLLGED